MIVEDSDPKQFLKNIEFAYSKEVEYSLILGLIERAIINAKMSHKMWRVFTDSKNLTALLLTQKNLVITEASDESIEKIVKYFREHNIILPGVVGPTKSVEKLAHLYAKAFNLNTKNAMSQKIYQLDKVNMPLSNGGGVLVQAQAHDVELIALWLVDFTKESLPFQTNNYDEQYNLAQSHIAAGNFYIWLQNGQAVSMACKSRATRNSATISAVYTPTDLRKNGYASQIVANLSQKNLDEGKKYCALYTDVANPTSNHIYQKIGYKEVATSAHYIFV